MFPKDIEKRRFLVYQLPLGVALLGSPVVGASEGRSLHLHNLHTLEQLTCQYFVNGSYLPPALSRIKRLFRDHRTGEQRDIDVNLLDTLYLLSQRFELNGPIEVISGFRSASTNAMLRRQSTGVARKSYHMLGRAVDCRFPDVPTTLLRDTAIEAARGGVGYYSRSDFVHLDTGPVRRW